jgi:hypothetical protein
MWGIRVNFVYLKPRLGLTKATVRARSRSNGKLEGRYTVPLGPGVAACDLVRRVPALRLRLNSQKANFISRKMGGLAGPAPARREAVPLTGPVTISFRNISNRLGSSSPSRPLATP